MNTDNIFHDINPRPVHDHDIRELAGELEKGWNLFSQESHAFA